MIGIGCTGGQHRSVAIAEKTAEFLRKKIISVPSTIGISTDQKGRSGSMKKKQKSYLEALKWLYPNLGIKRYFLLAVLGIFLVAGGLAVFSYGERLGILKPISGKLSTRLPEKRSFLLYPRYPHLFIGLITIYIALKKMLKSIITVLLLEMKIGW